MNRLKLHLQAFFSAVGFLSWLPVPAWSFNANALPLMGIYFPLTGAMLGGFASLFLFITSHWFPHTVAVALLLLFYGWITGMFHEDALADVFDSFGGYDRDKRLEIMRDSRVGTYGAYALCVFFVLRYAALTSLSVEIVCKNLIAFAATARFAGVLFLTASKPVMTSGSLGRTVLFTGQWGRLMVSLVILLLLLFITGVPNGYAVLGIVPVIVFVSRFYFYRKLGGVSGDCAGFVVHLTETFLHVHATAGFPS